jgi:hypothetical protein
VSLTYHIDMALSDHVDWVNHERFLCVYAAGNMPRASGFPAYDCSAHRRQVGLGNNIFHLPALCRVVGISKEVADRRSRVESAAFLFLAKQRSLTPALMRWSTTRFWKQLYVGEESSSPPESQGKYHIRCNAAIASPGLRAFRSACFRITRQSDALGNRLQSAQTVSAAKRICPPGRRQPDEDGSFQPVSQFRLVRAA